MLMIQGGIEVYCLPDGACCEVDENYLNSILSKSRIRNMQRKLLLLRRVI